VHTIRTDVAIARAAMRLTRPWPRSTLDIQRTLRCQSKTRPNCIAAPYISIQLIRHTYLSTLVVGSNKLLAFVICDIRGGNGWAVSVEWYQSMRGGGLPPLVWHMTLARWPSVNGCSGCDRMTGSDGRTEKCVFTSATLSSQMSQVPHIWLECARKFIVHTGLMLTLSHTHKYCA
jgi:hypothetical protein